MDLIAELTTEFRAWLEVVRTPGFWWQPLVLALAAIGSWLVHRTLGEALRTRSASVEQHRLRQLTLKTAQRILFPLSMLLGVFVGRAILQSFAINTGLLNLAVPLLLSLAVIRFVVYSLRKSFKPSPAVKAWENIISSSIWLIVALHLLGWLPEVLEAMDAMAFKLGDNRISVLTVTKLLMLIVLLWVMALWLASVIERRLLGSKHVSAGMQVALAKVARFFLVALAFLLALDAVGIDLTALAVFGGALGVGLGFGLQRIASNFISGFIVLFDRSIRPGDVITVGTKFGWVQELRARYIVVRDRDGVETLIPNETLVTTEVINWSYTDSNVRMKIPVQVSYSDDPEQGMELMLEVARNTKRVLQDPEPACRLIEFGDNGITLELRVWINDPQNGTANVRSDVNIGIWRAFKAANITIPFPQRDVHIKSSEQSSVFSKSDPVSSGDSDSG